MRQFFSLVVLSSSASAQWTANPLATDIPFGSNSQLRCGDLDGDGDVDVLVAISPLSRLSWFETTGPSTPSVEHVISTSVQGVLVAELGDLEGDGDLDVLGGRQAEFAWFENDGQGGFTAQHPIPPPSQSQVEYATSAELADLDRDGDLDLLLSIRPSNSTGAGAPNRVA